MSYQFGGSLWEGNDRMDTWYQSMTGREVEKEPLQPTKPMTAVEALYPGYDCPLQYPAPGKKHWYYLDGAESEPDSQPSSMQWAPMTSVAGSNTVKKTNPVETLLLAIKQGAIRKRRASFKIFTGVDGDILKPKKLIKKNSPKPQAIPVDFKPEIPDSPTTTPWEARFERYRKEHREAGEVEQIRQRRIAASCRENQFDTIALAQVEFSRFIPIPVVTPVTPVTPPDVAPGNTLGSAQFQFSQAGLSLTTQDHIGSYFASIGTSVAAPFALEEGDDAELVKKYAATADFYGDSAVEESPSPNHVPAINEESGYADILEGLTEFPQHWTSPPEQSLKYYTVEEVNAILRAATYGPDDAEKRVILVPKSQIAHLERMRIIGSWVRSIDNSAGYEHVGKMCRKDSYRNLYPTVNAKKRKAPGSFVTKFNYAKCNHSDDSVQYICAKKARVEERKRLFPVAPTYSPITPIDSPPTPPQGISPGTIPSNNEPAPDSTINTSLTTVSSNGDSERESGLIKSPITASSDDELDAVSNPSKIFPNRRVFPPAVIGYPGQFRGIGLEEKLINGASAEKGIQMTMGDCLHANYTFVHNNFHVCVGEDMFDHNKETAERCMKTIDHAYNETEKSAKLPRTESQENLRREIQLECTSARLEGVGVGQYRYYQGHLNIEEYRDANICICWDICACSKMCSRFGDIICPCSSHIDLEEQ